MAEEYEEIDSKKSKRGGLLLMIVPAALAGAVALGITYIAPWADKTGDTDAGATGEVVAASDGHDGEGDPVDNEGHADGAASARPKPRLVGAEGHSKQKGKGEAHAAFAIMPLEPFIVSVGTVQPGRRSSRLRLVVAVEAEEAAFADEAVTALLLRDAFTKVINGTPPETLGGPDGLEVLRQELLKMARTVLGEDAVASVLITEYLMT